MQKWARILLALISAFLLNHAALAEGVLCVSCDGVAALLSQDGSEIVAPGVWTDAFCVLEGERYALGNGEAYALCDAEGSLLTEAEYEMFQAVGDVILFQQDGLYGAMDFDGNVILSAEYAQLTTSDGEVFLATFDDPYDEESDEIYIVSAQEEPVGTGIMVRGGLSALADGRMPYQDVQSALYGYLNGEGETVIAPQFDAAGAFENGLACVSLDGMLGMIDVEGNWMIEAQFSYLERGDGIIVGLIGRETCVVFDDETCSEIFRVDGANLSAAVVGSWTIVLQGSAMTAYDADGTVRMELDSTATLSEGLDGQYILSDGAWGTACYGLVDSSGACAERLDQYLLPLSDGRYAFYKMTVAAYYSESLEEIRYSVDYDSLLCGMIDSEGREILPAEYTEIRALGYGCFLTVKSDGLRVVDAEGEVLWSLVEEEAES